MLLMAVVLALASCGGDADGDGAMATRPLERREAALLAGVLFENHSAGGARYQARAVLRASGDTIQLDGEIDWTTHTGRATLTASGPESAIVEVRWTASSVFERVPALDALLDDDGHADVDYIERPPEPRRRHLDAILAVLTGLATTQRDNPQLVSQEPSAYWAGDDEIDGVPVQRLAYQGVTYSIGDDGRLHRLETELGGAAQQLVIDLQLGPREVELPQPASVEARRDVVALYDRVVAPDGSRLGDDGDQITAATPAPRLGTGEGFRRPVPDTSR